MADKTNPVQYSSHPIMNYSIGKFQFKGGLLKLESDDDVKEFERIHATLPRPEQARLKKIDIGMAEEIARRNIDKLGGATKVFDSSVGERASNAPKLGKGKLEDSNPPESEAQEGDADKTDEPVEGTAEPVDESSADKRPSTGDVFGNLLNRS